MTPTTTQPYYYHNRNELQSQKRNVHFCVPVQQWAISLLIILFQLYLDLFMFTVCIMKQQYNIQTYMYLYNLVDDGHTVLLFNCSGHEM